ncbi:MAG TPA: two-component regulator propeller domain-containing protein, partial [Kofleriaceae bacterium]|nr:two-component regulator propeller domain-containing protein [Kofleriaceae bacterium]
MGLLRCCAFAILVIAAQVSLARGLPAPAPAPGPVAPAAPAAAPVVDDVPAGRLKFRVYAGADGLKNLIIVSIAQDAQGFLWLATDDGVYRFDGERFTRFAVDDGLSSSLIYEVAIAPEGEVCAGTNKGMACWDGARFSQALARGMPSVRVRSMVAYGGRMWVGTDGAGLYVRDGSGTFVPAPGWPGTTTVRAMWADGAGLVVSADTTVVESTGDGVWRPIGDVGLGHERIDNVARDRDGALWIRTPNRLWQLPAGADHAIERGDGLPPGHTLLDAPHSLGLDARGEILVGTDAGVAIWRGERWRLLERASGTAAAVVRAVFVDREGTLWLGSSGLVQLRGRGLIERHDATNGLPGDVAWSFGRDRAGGLWAGTTACLAGARGGRWTCLPGTEGRVVRSFAWSPHGGVFLAGVPADLMYIDAAGHAETLDLPPPDGDRPVGDDHRDILAIAFAPDGDLWIASKAGLYRLRGGEVGPIEHVEVPGVAPYARFAGIAVAGDQVWATSAEGVVVLDHGTWYRFRAGDGLRATDVRYITARADGRMCVAYDESFGVTCFRYAAGKISAIEHITPAQGLSTGMVYFLGEDRDRRLWIGTGDGVDVMTSERAAGGLESQLEHFDTSDGLAGDDSAANGFFADRDGSLWLGATGGASHVRAQAYPGPPAPPHATLLGGRLGDRPLRRADGGWAPLDVSHTHNALVLELAAGTLVDAGRVEFQARLSPLETEWSPTRQRQVHYPALLPGAYRFEVRARIDGGAWGAASELRFTVHAAWWQTRWFYLALAAIGALAIAGGFAWRQRRVLVVRTRQLSEQADASFCAVIDQMPDNVSVHRGLDVLHVNLAARRFLGLDPAATTWGRGTLVDHIHPDDLPAVEDLFAKVRALPPQTSTDIVELRIRAADGNWRSCEIWGVLVLLGGMRTVIASSRDITERKRMRAKLLVSDRMASLGTLAAGIAHEINNPLAYVTGNLEVVAETLASDAPPSAVQRRELQVAIRDARDGAERVRKIVHGLRSFTRSEEEKRTAVALPGVLEAAIRMTSNQIRHRAELVRELGAVPLVVGDDGRLTQVFINLLVNAAHAIPEGRSDANRITVRTRTDAQGRAVVEVEDTGHGIAPEVQARVFDPFFTTKDVGEGTGLGLAICHGIVSGLGGQISIESAVRRAALDPGAPAQTGT